jgi:hypothetical protein
LYLTINFGGHLVIWSFVKIENTLSKSYIIIINIYLYYNERKSVFRN